VPHTILTVAYCKKKKSLSEPRGIFKDEKNGFEMELQAPSADSNGNCLTRTNTENAVFVCCYPTVERYGILHKKVLFDHGQIWE
jgi:hypothetical protein